MTLNLLFNIYRNILQCWTATYSAILGELCKAVEAASSVAPVQGQL